MDKESENEKVCDDRYEQNGKFQSWVIKKMDKLEKDFADLVKLIGGRDG